MAVDSTNRETIRDDIASLLDTALVDTLGIVQAVYNYQKLNIEGYSPVVMVLSSGDFPNRRAQTDRINSQVYLDVWTFVLHVDADNSWTEADAEDRLDEIKKEIVDTLFDNEIEQDLGLWEITFETRSTVSRVSIGGVPYLWEVTPLTVRFFAG